MLNRDLFKLERGLKAIGNLRGVKFLYAVEKNRPEVYHECDVLRKTIRPSDEYVNYDKERLELCIKLADKDNDDSPIMVNGNFKITNIKKFDKELKKLRNHYNGVTETRKKELEDFEKELDEEINIELHLVKLDNIPDDISDELMSNLIEMIQEE